jgi:hypothetical protein
MSATIGDLWQNGTFWPSDFNATREYEVFVDNVRGFVRTVDWSETWLQALLAAHVLTFLAIVVFRNSMRVQTTLFFALLVLCWLASYVDAWAAANWKLFTKFNYFNRGGGLFVAVVYAAPMMFNAMLILINFLRELARMLVIVKREQIRRQQHSAKTKSSNAPPPNDAAAARQQQQHDSKKNK